MRGSKGVEETESQGEGDRKRAYERYRERERVSMTGNLSGAQE
jgi:hypothetical protein